MSFVDLRLEKSPLPLRNPHVNRDGEENVVFEGQAGGDAAKESTRARACDCQALHGGTVM